MRTFLHVGCGPLRKQDTTRGFNAPSWREVRLDIDPNVEPDLVGTLTDLSAVADASVQAVFSSHNIEHLFAHEVPVALREFRRVLDDVGFLILTCPDLQSMCALVAQDKLLEPAYQEDKANFAASPYFSTDYVGAGPYRVKEWVLGSHVVQLLGIRALVVQALA